MVRVVQHQQNQDHLWVLGHQMILTDLGILAYLEYLVDPFALLVLRYNYRATSIEERFMFKA